MCFFCCAKQPYVMILSYSHLPLKANSGKSQYYYPEWASIWSWLVRMDYLEGYHSALRLLSARSRPDISASFIFLKKLQQNLTKLFRPANTGEECIILKHQHLFPMRANTTWKFKDLFFPNILIYFSHLTVYGGTMDKADGLRSHVAGAYCT